MHACIPLLTLAPDVHGFVLHDTSSIIASSQSPVTIADGVDSSPTEYIFSHNGSPISVSTGSTPQCTSSSCQHTFRVTSSQVQQYTVSVAARNVVGVGNPSTAVTVGMVEVPCTTKLAVMIIMLTMQS